VIRHPPRNRPGEAGDVVRMPVAIRTSPRMAEVAWFSAACGDDYEFLGVPDRRLRSSYEHCRAIVERADALG